MTVDGRRFLIPRGDSHAPVVAYGVGDAGAGTGAWKPVLDALRGGELEFRPVRLPGRENRLAESLLTKLEDQVDDVVAGLLPVLSADTRPYLLAGACSGATIAYEVARRLQVDFQRSPLALVVISQQAPHTSARGIPAKDGMSSEQLRDWFARGAEAPAGMNIDELFAFVEPMLRADIRAYETHRHRPGSPLQFPIVTVTGSRDPELSPSDLAAWAELTTKDGSGFTLDGDHQLTRSAPAELAAVLTAVALTATHAVREARSDA
jgi:surfactin synthase thioesterase subunit